MIKQLVMVKDINNNWSYIFDISLTERRNVSDQEAVGILQNDLTIDVNSILIEENEIYVLLDEFQYVKNAGLFIKTLFDAAKDKLQLIVSGSSSLEITKNSEFLTGRKIDFLLERFSFGEFLKARSVNNYDNFKFT